MAREDGFTRLSHGDQRAYVAETLGLSPSHPESWPAQIIERLVETRLRDGERGFYERLRELTHT